jgi:hypothetical protein
MLTDEEENLNKSLRQKQKVTGKWSQTCSLLMVRKELRDTHPQRPWQYYGYIFSGCTQKDSTGYEPESLGYMYNSLDRHLRYMKCPICGLHVQQPWQTIEIHEMSNLWVTCTTTLTDTWETYNVNLRVTCTTALTDTWDTWNVQSVGYMYNNLDRHLRDMKCQSLVYMYNSLDRYLIDMKCQSLGYMYNSLDRHLRDMKCPIRYVLTFKLVNIHYKCVWYL